MLVLLVLIFITICLCYNAIKPIYYWKNQGIAHKKPWPVVGNIGAYLFKQKSLMELCLEWYNEFANQQYFGVIQFGVPTLYIRDLDLIKKITVKDFDNFSDHNAIVSEDVDELLGNSLFGLKGQRWRNMRATLSPAFTSSKMKNMFTLLTDCAENFTNHFQKQGESLIVAEMKDVFTRFTNDAIASVAFGLKCDSLEDRNNEFYLMGKDATDFGGLRTIKIVFISTFPRIAKVFNMTFFPRRVVHFFRRVIKESVSEREKSGLVRPDLIHLMLEARKGTLKVDDIKSTDSSTATRNEVPIGKLDELVKHILTVEDMAAHALFFFFGGFETTSTLLCLVSYELALNDEIQIKLQNEIDETLSDCGGKITYEALLQMKYLDAIVSETLRKWPPGFLLDRLCVKDYNIDAVNLNEQPFLVKKGTLINIPVIGIHRDPKYFPNPNVFDPERFNDENKHNIKPYSYMPFGLGPRNCIASNLVLLKSKILLFNLLSKFDIMVVEKTPIPLILGTKTFNIVAKDGFWLGLRLRISH